MNNYAKRETWNNIWNQKDRINNDDNDIKDSAFFFLLIYLIYVYVDLFTFHMHPYIYV